ncbi:MAG: LacI family transcriptional regulator [Clostridiales bacterium]|nr:LacI family transcriptional regulator [Clostridiales bacterium]
MQKTQKKATVRDVAKKAGVSPATVSRVLSQSDYIVSHSMRKKVIQTAEELGLFLDVNDKQKPEQKIEVGIIVPNFSNPYFWQIAIGVESEAYREGISVYLCNSYRNAAQETKYLHSLFRKGISGILLSPTSDNHEEIAALQKQGLIVILLEQSAADLNCGKILFNYLKAAKMAIEYLSSNGHKQIAFVSAPITLESRHETFLGYKLGLLESGLTFRDDYVICVDYKANLNDEFYEYELGRACATPFSRLKPMPTAVFCLNDMIALGFINGLNSLGIHAPDDVSVIGLDNIQASVISTPTLTTISQPSFEIGRLAYKMLLDAITNQKSGDFSISVEPSLIERESVKNIMDFHD